jgi:hypothetical protein
MKKWTPQCRRSSAAAALAGYSPSLPQNLLLFYDRCLSAERSFKPSKLTLSLILTWGSTDMFGFVVPAQEGTQSDKSNFFC